MAPGSPDIANDVTANCLHVENPVGGARSVFAFSSASGELRRARRGVALLLFRSGPELAQVPVALLGC